MDRRRFLKPPDLTGLVVDFRESVEPPLTGQRCGRQGPPFTDEEN